MIEKLPQNDLQPFHIKKKLKKLYYKIGEVSDLTNLASHVIRFWESQFKQLSPRKTPSGHRIYSQKDIETIFLIKELLYEKKFTIKGAKEYLEEIDKNSKPLPIVKNQINKREVLQKLKYILSLLSRKV